MDDFIKPKIQPFGAGVQNDAPVEPVIEEPPSKPSDPISNIETIELDMDITPNKNKGPNMSRKPRFNLKNLTKKQIIIISVIAVLVVCAGVAAYFLYFSKDDAVAQVVKKATPTKVKKEVVVTSPLTGVVLKDANLAKRPVTGIMIENSPDARPQSGLNEAGIVYEAIAEGGITRFLALYQESTPQYIGPVRSARPYYVNFALSFDASYAHVGGSPDALNDIKSLGVKDLDQFHNSQAYWRISERYAPHNMYTSFEKLDALNTAKGYTSSTFTSFEHKKDVPQTPTAATIDFSISSYLYSPTFTYDPATNSYKRAQGGEAHTDQKSGAQINPKVIIAMVMEKGIMSDGSHTTYTDTGSGKIYVFQDGIVSEGTWNKTDRKSPIQLTDKNGLSMKLNAGQTWISAVGSPSDVGYKP